MDLVEARNIEEGECFRKRNGEYVYIRLSESSVKHYELDTSLVYGVCFNGNVTDINMSKLVVSMPVTAMIENRIEQLKWENRIGVNRDE